MMIDYVGVHTQKLDLYSYAEAERQEDVKSA
jgi:hypothetical protein